MEKVTSLAEFIRHMLGFDPYALPQMCLTDALHQILMKLGVFF
jgi:hypothetical protein